MAPSGGDSWIVVVSALLTGGTGKFVYDTYKDWRSQPSRTQREVATVDASIITVSRARDELEEDNARIRATLAEERINWISERERFERERAAWMTERAGLRGDIERLEAQIRQERTESAARYDALLERLSRIAKRTAGVDTGQLPPVKDDES